MSLKKNTLANYLGTGYTTLVGIVMLPLYLKYLGAEAYGLVGFFTMMQAWFGLLDMGLSPTLSRQVAQCRGQSDGGTQLSPLVRSIEWIFAFLAILVTLAILLASSSIAKHWLTVQSISISEVEYCISLMGGMVGLRWFIVLYRGGIQGAEQMVWLNATNVVFASARFGGAYILLRWISQDPAHFFEFQLVLSLLELLFLGKKFYKSLQSIGLYNPRFSLVEMKSIIPFAGGIAYTSALWIMLTQTDKLILSNTLPLREFGYFALVAVVANGLLSLSGPISQAILPRMTLLLAQGNDAGMIALYRKATRLVAAIIFPITGTIAIYPNEILFLWTGDHTAADWAGPILRWFVLGNGILAIAAFQYYLQFAHGKLRLHLINSTINAVVQVPLLAYSAFEYGAIGVAYTWFGIRLITFLIFTAIVHHRFAKGLHLQWLVGDVMTGIGVTAIVLVPAHSLMTLATKLQVISNTQLLIFIILSLCLSIAATLIFASEKHYTLLKYLNKGWYE